MEKIIKFVDTIKGEKLIKAAGICLIVLGIFGIAILILGNLLAYYSEIMRETMTKSVSILDYSSSILDTVAGILALYFAKHKEKNIFATAVAMLLVLVGTFSANLYSEFFMKAMIYVSLIPAYLFVFGATRQREQVKQEKYQKYVDFYNKYKDMHEE